MARAPLAIGTAGRIRWYRRSSGWVARCLYRDYDGVTRQIERVGMTKYAAELNLKTALRDRARVDGTPGEIGSATRFEYVAEAWFGSLVDRAPSTMQAYRYCLDTLVLPALGQVRVRELSVGLVDRHLTTVKTQHGPALAKQTRSVLSGICNLACRHDAMASNPVRDTGKISAKPKKPPTALGMERARQLLAKLHEDKAAVSRDLPDLVAYMLATGCRIGEASALTWADVDLDGGTVEVRGTVLRLKGQGLVIKPSTKSAAGQRKLELPSWCVAMLRRRRREPGRGQNASDPVFPAPKGGLRDPSNSNADLKAAFTKAGEPNLTSHVLRKTVASMMDDAGLTARQAADQLGHSKPSLTMDVYLGRKVQNTGAARLLEALDPEAAPAPGSRTRSGTRRPTQTGTS